MKTDEISKAISVLLDTAYHAISNLQGSREETLEFLNSGACSESEYVNVMEDLDNEIKQIKDSADILLDFKIILNRHSRIRNAMSEVNSEITEIFSFDT